MKNYTSNKKNNNECFWLCALAGVDVIGMNLYLYGFGPEHARRWLIVDYGLGFSLQKYPGTQFMLVSKDCIAKILPKTIAIIITHAHEDHMGALIHEFGDSDVPIYATNFAREMMRGKMQDFSLNHSNISLLNANEKLVFDEVTVTPLPVSHSVPETMALLLETPHKRILHSSDFCFEKVKDKELYKGMDEFNEAVRLDGGEVDILLCDSTGVLSLNPQVNEAEVAENLATIFATAKARIFITCFSSNITRFESIYRAVVKCNKNFFVMGRSINRAIKAAQQAKLWRHELPKDIYEADSKEITEADTVVLVSGCQGEYNSSMARLAFANSKKIKLKKNDTVVFSARVIPGRELNINSLQNALAELGVNVITNNEAKIHSQGHANREQLQFFLQKISPKLLIPMHGERRHIAAAANMAESLGISVYIPKTAQLLGWKKSKIKPSIEQKIDCKHDVCDGNTLVDTDDIVYKERPKMAYAGHVCVFVRKDCDITTITRGIPASIISQEQISELVGQFIKETKNNDLYTNEKLEELTKRFVKKTIDKTWGKKPICDVVIS